MSRDASTRLIIWRHGLTEWNAADRVQGQVDAPLAELGRQQAAEAAKHLAGLAPDAIVASDLSRAADTAAALATATGLPVKSDERLRERHFGAWQGLTLAEIAERHPDEYTHWQAGEPDPGCGVEPVARLAARATQALRDAAGDHPGGTVVAVCHGGTARQGVGGLLELPRDATMRLRGLGNCHWAELRHGARGWTLWAYNVNW